MSEKIPPHCPPDDPCIWCREARLESLLEEMAIERDEAREQLTDMLKLLLPRTAGEPALVADQIDVPLTGSPLVLRLVESMVSMLNGKGPGNFHAISFQSAKDGQEYSLTIQREGGKTPAQRITELERELSELRRKVWDWAGKVDTDPWNDHIIREMREALKC